MTITVEFLKMVEKTQIGQS